VVLFFNITKLCTISGWALLSMEKLLVQASMYPKRTFGDLEIIVAS